MPVKRDSSVLVFTLLMSSRRVVTNVDGRCATNIEEPSIAIAFFHEEYSANSRMQNNIFIDFHADFVSR